MVELEETTVDHYRIERRLARGGMSMVYVATDEQTQQHVAIKVVHNSDSEEVRRFLREVKALTELQHEHILPILDYGVHGCWHYLVMPYIEGGTLRMHLEQGPLAPEEAGPILDQVADALQYAHERGILHRDIKPSNILLENGTHVYLADFGLAKEIDEDVSLLTQTGCLIGTPEYMAPELAEEPASVRSDVYALGIVLYQMLTGRSPFKGNTPIATYWKHIKEQPVLPSVLNAAISPAVEQVVLRALEKDPWQRFESVQAMAHAYQRALSGLLTEGSSAALALPPTVQRIIAAPVITRAAFSRQPVFVTLVALLLLLAIPLWLGFSVYTDSIPQISGILGANAQFAVLPHPATTSTGYVPPKPTATATPSTSHSSEAPPWRRPQTSVGSNGHGHEHGHKHGHKHGGN